MTLAKFLLLLGICSLAASLPSEQNAPRALEPIGNSIKADPKTIISTESMRPTVPTLSITLQGYRDTATDKYYVAIEVVNIPIFQTDAVPPPAGETTIPDNDDNDNIQVYFGNEDFGRILEVRFNRFQQTMGRLWKRPYNLLRDDVDVSVEGINVGQLEYSMTVMVPAETLPANMDRVHAVVVDATKEGGDKYYTHYRLYNHPIAYDWNMKVWKLYQKETLYDLVPESINGNYTSWWEGI